MRKRADNSGNRVEIYGYGDAGYIYLNGVPMKGVISYSVEAAYGKKELVLRLDMDKITMVHG